MSGLTAAAGGGSTVAAGGGSPEERAVQFCQLNHGETAVTNGPYLDAIIGLANKLYSGEEFGPILKKILRIALNHKHVLISILPPGGEIPDMCTRFKVDVGFFPGKKVSINYLLLFIFRVINKLNLGLNDKLDIIRRLFRAGFYFADIKDLIKKIENRCKLEPDDIALIEAFFRDPQTFAAVSDFGKTFGEQHDPRNHSELYRKYTLYYEDYSNPSKGPFGLPMIVDSTLVHLFKDISKYGKVVSVGEPGNDEALTTARKSIDRIAHMQADLMVEEVLAVMENDGIDRELMKKALKKIIISIMVKKPEYNEYDQIVSYTLKIKYNTFHEIILSILTGANKTITFDPACMTKEPSAVGVLGTRTMELSQQDQHVDQDVDQDEDIGEEAEAGAGAEAEAEAGAGEEAEAEAGVRAVAGAGVRAAGGGACSMKRDRREQIEGENITLGLLVETLRRLEDVEHLEPGVTVGTRSQTKKAELEKQLPGIAQNINSHLLALLMKIKNGPEDPEELGGGGKKKLPSPKPKKKSCLRHRKTKRKQKKQSHKRTKPLKRRTRKSI